MLFHIIPLLRSTRFPIGVLHHTHRRSRKMALQQRAAKGKPPERPQTVTIANRKVSMADLRSSAGDQHLEGAMTIPFSRRLEVWHKLVDMVVDYRVGGTDVAGKVVKYLGKDKAIRTFYGRKWKDEFAPIFQTAERKGEVDARKASNMKSVTHIMGDEFLHHIEAINPKLLTATGLRHLRTAAGQQRGVEAFVARVNRSIVDRLNHSKTTHFGRGSHERYPIQADVTRAESLEPFNEVSAGELRDLQLEIGPRLGIIQAAPDRESALENEEPSTSDASTTENDAQDAAMTATSFLRVPNTAAEAAAGDANASSEHVMGGAYTGQEASGARTDAIMQDAGHAAASNDDDNADAADADAGIVPAVRHQEMSGARTDATMQDAGHAAASDDDDADAADADAGTVPEASSQDAMDVDEGMVPLAAESSMTRMLTSQEPDRSPGASSGRQALATAWEAASAELGFDPQIMGESLNEIITPDFCASLQTRYEMNGGHWPSEEPSSPAELCERIRNIIFGAKAR